MSTLRYLALLLLSCLSLLACAQSNTPSDNAPPAVNAPISKPAPGVVNSKPAGMQMCQKRSEICAAIHKPVCAQRDSGIRCVRAPCPSEESKTYENACAACRDSKVIGYVDGACGSPAVVDK